MAHSHRGASHNSRHEDRDDKDVRGADYGHRPRDNNRRSERDDNQREDRKERHRSRSRSQVRLGSKSQYIKKTDRG